MLKDKIEALSSDSVYYNLLVRFDQETQSILQGAGNDEDWLTLFNQIRDREKEILGL